LIDPLIDRKQVGPSRSVPGSRSAGRGDRGKGRWQATGLTGDDPRHRRSFGWCRITCTACRRSATSASPRTCPVARGRGGDRRQVLGVRRARTVVGGEPSRTVFVVQDAHGLGVRVAIAGHDVRQRPAQQGLRVDPRASPQSHRPQNHQPLRSTPVAGPRVSAAGCGHTVPRTRAYRPTITNAKAPRA